MASTADVRHRAVKMTRIKCKILSMRFCNKIIIITMSKRSICIPLAAEPIGPAHFLPRDAMHPRYWPWACVRPYGTSRCSIKTVERIELGFVMLASFHPSYTVLKENSVISKNKGTSLWNFVLNSGLRKFRHGIPVVETCYQLSSRKVDAQCMINWAVVGQLSR